LQFRGGSNGGREHQVRGPQRLVWHVTAGQVPSGVQHLGATR
jgi:hypothetical protein